MLLQLHRCQHVGILAFTSLKQKPGQGPKNVSQGLKSFSS